jgi:hypothetical protein
MGVGIEAGAEGASPAGACTLGRGCRPPTRPTPSPPSPSPSVIPHAAAEAILEPLVLRPDPELPRDAGRRLRAGTGQQRMPNRRRRGCRWRGLRGRDSTTLPSFSSSDSLGSDLNTSGNCGCSEIIWSVPTPRRPTVLLDAAAAACDHGRGAVLHGPFTRVLNLFADLPCSYSLSPPANGPE